MQIYGPYRVSTTQPNSPPQRSQPQKPADTAAQASRRHLWISSTFPAAFRVSIDLIRQPKSLVAVKSGSIVSPRFAARLADGSYETPEKLDAALDRLLDQLA